MFDYFTLISENAAVYHDERIYDLYLDFDYEEDVIVGEGVGVYVDESFFLLSAFLAFMISRFLRLDRRRWLVKEKFTPGNSLFASTISLVRTRIESTSNSES